MTQAIKTPLVRTSFELVIIVVGVLIALAVDSWSEGRRERVLEQHYLEALARDLRGDSVAFQQIYLPALAQKDSALRLVAPVVRGARLEGDTLDFIRAVGLGGRLGSTSSSGFTISTTHDELVATGNLSLIRSDSLRAAVVQHYFNMSNQADRLRSRLPNYPMYVHAYFPAELRGAERVEVTEAFGLERAMRGFRSAEFEALMNQELNYMYFAQRVYTAVADQTNEMLRRVEAVR